MTKHEKHSHAPAGQGRETHEKVQNQKYDPLDELEGSEELLKTSFTAGNEMKIALGVIAVLLVIFAAALVKWMRHSSAPASPPGEETALKQGDKKPIALDKDFAEPRGKSPFGAASRSSELTVAPAKPDPNRETRPKSRADDSGGWPSVSDGKSKSEKAAEDRSSSPPSFSSRIPLGDSVGRAGSTTARDLGKSSFAGFGKDSNSASQAANSPTSDPFQSRSAAAGLRRENSSMPAAAPSPFGSSMADPTRGTPRPGEAMASSGASRAPQTAAGSNPLRFPDVSSEAPARPSALSARSDGMSLGGSLASRGAAGRRNDGTYVVQANDNYWSISTALYGTGVYYQALAKANPKKREDSLKAGDVILAPTTSELATRYPDLCPNTAPRGVPESRPRMASTPSVPSGQGGGRAYVVQPGDNIYEVARQELGKASRWREIYDLNKDVVGTQSLELTPGTRLLLPDASSATLSQRNDSGQRR